MNIFAAFRRARRIKKRLAITPPLPPALSAATQAACLRVHIAATTRYGKL